MVPIPKSFTFTKYTADWTAGILTFSYATELVDGTKHEFTETLQIPGAVDIQRAIHPSVARVCEMIQDVYKRQITTCLITLGTLKGILDARLRMS